MAALSTDLSMLCRDKSFVCNLPNSGGHVIRPNQGLSTGRRDNQGMRLENLEILNKVARFSLFFSRTRLNELFFPLAE